MYRHYLDRIGVFSDLHLHPWPAFSRPDPKTGLSSRLVHGINIVNEIAERAKKLKVGTLLFGGDWVHVRRVPIEVYSATRLALTALMGLELVAIAGNHDSIDPLTQHHSLEILDTRIRLINRTTGPLTSAKAVVGGLPYAEEAGQIYLAAKEAAKERCKIFLCHAPFQGAEMASDFVTPPDKDAVDPRELLKLLPKDCVVIAGHYHQPQYYDGDRWRVPAGKHAVNPRIIIPGAPMQHTFGDAGSARGWWYQDNEEDWVFEPLNVHAESAPHFHQLGFDQFLREPELVRGNFIHLELPASMKGSALKDLVAEVAQDAAGFTYEIEAPEREEKARTGIGPATPPQEALKEFAERHPPPDRKRALALGAEILGAVLKGGA